MDACQIHETDLVHWLSIYSQEGLLSAVNAPQLEAAIVSQFNIDGAVSALSSVQDSTALFDGHPHESGISFNS